MDKRIDGITIREATRNDLDALSEIVGRYRSFYGVVEQEPSEVTRFIGERIENNESVILIAVCESSRLIIGFIQLYPVFSTVSLKRQWLLNDLFIEEHARNKGIGSALMEAAKEFFRGKSKGFILVTAKTNLAAKQFYDKHGWQTDMYDFYTYYYG